MNSIEDKTEATLKTPSRDDFAAQLNTKFRFFQEPNWIEATLIEISEIKSLPRQERFNLVFQMPPEFAAQQGNYSFEHEKLGASEIFIIPFEVNAGGTLFEAVFNQILEKS